MAIDRFLIAPLEEGLRTDLKPWLIPDSAYAELNNAYIFRGRLKKKVRVSVHWSCDWSLDRSTKLKIKGSTRHNEWFWCLIRHSSRR